MNHSEPSQPSIEVDKHPTNISTATSEFTLLQDKNMQYRFFCKNSKCTLEYTKEPIWEPFQDDIQIYLNEKYSEFQQGNFAAIDLITPLHDYYINFKYNLQILKTEISTGRLINIQKIPHDTQNPENSSDQGISSFY